MVLGKGKVPGAAWTCLRQTNPGGGLCRVKLTSAKTAAFRRAAPKEPHHISMSGGTLKEISGKILDEMSGDMVGWVEFRAGASCGCGFRGNLKVGFKGYLTLQNSDGWK